MTRTARLATVLALALPLVAALPVADASAQEADCPPVAPLSGGLVRLMLATGEGTSGGYGCGYLDRWDYHQIHPGAVEHWGSYPSPGYVYDYYCDHQSGDLDIVRETTNGTGYASVSYQVENHKTSSRHWGVGVIWNTGNPADGELPAPGPPPAGNTIAYTKNCGSTAGQIPSYVLWQTLFDSVTLANGKSIPSAFDSTLAPADGGTVTAGSKLGVNFTTRVVSQYMPDGQPMYLQALKVINLTGANGGTNATNATIPFGNQTTYGWAAGSNYQAFTGDFNGDGQADIGLRDANNGTFYFKHGPSYSDQVTYGWAAGSNYQAFTGDFSGDGQADIGLRDANNGAFYFKLGPSFGNQFIYQWAGGSNYSPIVGDFNRDGVADIGLRDGNNGTIYFQENPGRAEQWTVVSQAKTSTCATSCGGGALPWTPQQPGNYTLRVVYPGLNVAAPNLGYTPALSRSFTVTATSAPTAAAARNATASAASFPQAAPSGRRSRALDRRLEVQPAPFGDLSIVNSEFTVPRSGRIRSSLSKLACPRGFALLHVEAASVGRKAPLGGVTVGRSKPGGVKLNISRKARGHGAQAQLMCRRSRARRVVRKNGFAYGTVKGDRIRMRVGRKTAFGGLGADRITIYRKRASAIGGLGDDRITLRSGRTNASGGPGDDTLRSTARGRTLLWGGLGNDRLIGSRGPTLLNALDGKGGDTIRCRSDRNRVMSDPGDTLIGPCKKVSVR